LSKLQDDVPAFPFSQVQEIVERELSAPLGEIFHHFHEEPLAAASIGQVHRARLKSGEEVIVKVQRPGIRTTIAVDLEIMFHLAELMEKYLEEGDIYRPTLMVEEFSRTLEMEMNYSIEAAHAERFAEQFAADRSVYVPRIFRHASTAAVLTMEYLAGIKSSDIARLDAEGYDRKLIASRGADLILAQIFKYRFFHADPHPGNVYILPGNVVCYLDFGMMGRVSRAAQERFASMIFGYVLRDEKKVAEAVLGLLETSSEPDRNILERDVLHMMETHLYRPLKELRIGDLVSSLLDFFARHRLRLPPDIFLMIKALAETESIGVALDPDFDMSRKVAPFIRQLKLDRLNPGRLFKDFLETGEEMVQMLKDIPRDLGDIVKQLKQGRVKIGFEHRGLEKLIFEMDRSSNRVSFALIISSIVIGSSLIITADLGPHIFGIPILGLAGYTIAGLMGLWLIISILRSGKI
ncbi:MAG: AarF/UbiB family protein, partial [Smithellaceae bacterium]|nr:AarF/UbiB family protein [Smithellaceae bacterium]